MREIRLAALARRLLFEQRDLNLDLAKLVPLNLAFDAFVAWRLGVVGHGAEARVEPVAAQALAYIEAIE